MKSVPTTLVCTTLCYFIWNNALPTQSNSAKTMPADELQTASTNISWTGGWRVESYSEHVPNEVLWNKVYRISLTCCVWYKTCCKSRGNNLIAFLLYRIENFSRLNLHSVLSRVWVLPTCFNHARALHETKSCYIGQSSNTHLIEKMPTHRVCCTV